MGKDASTVIGIVLTIDCECIESQAYLKGPGLLPSVSSRAPCTAVPSLSCEQSGAGMRVGDVASVS